MFNVQTPMIKTVGPDIEHGCLSLEHFIVPPRQTFTISPMGRLLDAAYGLAAVATAPIWGARMLRTGKWRTDWDARFAKPHALPDLPGDAAGGTILIHAVSVGEVAATRLLVEKLRELAPDVRVVLAVTTDTGLARARSQFEDRIPIVRYPLDFTGPVHRFLDHIRPDVFATVELELWPNMVQACKKRGIRVCVINGRLSERSFRGYRKIRPLVRPMFASLDLAAVQTKEYADRFIALGTPAERVQVTDTMKWDTATITDHVEGADELAEAMGIDRNKPIVVAGSTGKGEEKMFIERLPEGVQLVLVPRKPERFEEVAALSPTMIRRSEHPDGTARPLDGTRLFLIDTMGELTKAYSLADIAIVGRTFNGWGGSDPIEPIALGKATIVGPDCQNFAAVIDMFYRGDCIRITLMSELTSTIARLLTHASLNQDTGRAGRDMVIARQGGTGRQAAMLLSLINFIDVA